MKLTHFLSLAHPQRLYLEFFTLVSSRMFAFYLLFLPAKFIVKYMTKYKHFMAD